MQDASISKWTEWYNNLACRKNQNFEINTISIRPTGPSINKHGEDHVGLHPYFKTVYIRNDQNE